ncbi:MAG: glycerophosphodiester phosphodiesterase [Moraxellaceae bacterium]|nr:glycerophosphodiester phosphodiesterase [Moraxellaceae bacterium]
MDIIGHRGAKGEAPENTLSGFRYLMAMGLRQVEFDIHVSADGQLIVIHDKTLERTTNGIGFIKNKTQAVLASLDACHTLFPQWPDNDGVPSLADVLTLLKDFDHLQLEVKTESAEDCMIVAEQLPALWQAFGSRAVTTSFNIDYLRLMQQTQPQIPRGLLVEEYFQGDIISLAQSLGCKLIAPHHQLLHLDLIQQAHQHGLMVSTWTVNQTQRMIDLQNMGLDSLITDYPSLALKTL